MRRALGCLAPLALAATACGGDRGRSPVCGFAQVAGPALIQDRLRNARALLTDAPRGLPGRLPARVVGQQQQDEVQVGYTERSASGQLVLSYQGPGFHVRAVNDTMTYAVLVVDDTSERAMGILVYETRRPPPDYPQLGTLEGTGGATVVPVYGVRVNWAGTSNPRCPLLGPTPAPPDRKP